MSVESLSCSQCATSPRTPATLSECTLSPPSPTPCPQSASYCLILKEYNPSLSDDADAAMADSAGSLHFLARTCVGENVGDTCSTGNKSSTGKIVTVCRYQEGYPRVIDSQPTFIWNLYSICYIRYNPQYMIINLQQFIFYIFEVSIPRYNYDFIHRIQTTHYIIAWVRQGRKS